MSLTWSLIAPAGMQAVQPPTVPPDDRAAFIASAVASTKPMQKSADWSHLARNWSPLSKAATSCASAWPTSTATAQAAAGGQTAFVPVLHRQVKALGQVVEPHL